MRVATRLLVACPPCSHRVDASLRCSSRCCWPAACRRLWDDDSESVTDLLDKAFKSSIGSADMTLDISIELDGVDELDGPIEIKFTGPYDSTREGPDPKRRLGHHGQAQNQSFNANLTSTGDRAFVGFQGTDYEVSQATVDA